MFGTGHGFTPAESKSGGYGPAGAVEPAREAGAVMNVEIDESTHARYVGSIRLLRNNSCTGFPGGRVGDICPCTGAKRQQGRALVPLPASRRRPDAVPEGACVQKICAPGIENGRIHVIFSVPGAGVIGAMNGG